VQSVFQDTIGRDQHPPGQPAIVSRILPIRRFGDRRQCRRAGHQSHRPAAVLAGIEVIA